MVKSHLKIVFQSECGFKFTEIHLANILVVKNISAFTKKHFADRITQDKIISCICQSLISFKSRLVLQRRRLCKSSTLVILNH